MITEKQIKILEDAGIQVRSYDGGLRQAGNIAKCLAEKWPKMDFDTKNKIQKELMGVELSTRQEYTNYLLKNSIKLTNELIRAMQVNAELGRDISMLDSSEVLYESIEKAIRKNMYIDVSCTKELKIDDTLIEYAEDNDMAFIVAENKEAIRIRKKYRYEHVYSMDRLEEINDEVREELNGALVGRSVAYADFQNIPMEVKTGLVDALKGR